MAKINATTPKGFRDFLGNEARMRLKIINRLASVFERFGFEPLITPALEYAEVLKGKYGEEEKLIYEFTDRGGREVALRYDQTVPLARVISNYPNLTKPYKRYQMQSVWRAENPQKGRYREFIQVDFDSIGVTNILSDSEIVACSIAALEELGFEKFTLKVNDREIFSGLPNSVISTIDKLDKIGTEGVLSLLKSQNYSDFQAADILKRVTDSVPTNKINELFNTLEKMKVRKGTYAFDPTLARGLDYYTSLIFEMEIEGYDAGSVGGGGRYDKLIGVFTDNSLPAVGFSFGFDRIIEALTMLNQENQESSTEVLVTIFKPELLEISLETTSYLRSMGINTEIYLDSESKLDKQIRYADQKKISFVIIVGPSEIEKKVVTLKNLKNNSQEEIKLSQVKNLIDHS